MSDYIPQDALIDILARLPIKSLVICTSVCKSWRSLITNPSFITSHLNHPANNIAKDLILVRHFSEERKEGQYLLHYDNETFGEYSMLGFRLDGYTWNYRVLGICNGVICLSNDATSYGYGMFLWNPSIQKLVKLPPVRVSFNSHGPYMQGIGFGIDPLTNDFKIVRAVYLDCEIVPAEVDVYSLSRGTWRNISASVGLKNFIAEHTSQAYLGGIVHWIGSYGRGKGNLIVSFHMGNEVFGEMELPSSFHGTWLMMGNVCAFVYQQHSLALIETEGCVSGCIIWVMREYGITESWTKMFTFDFTEKIDRGPLLVYDPYTGIVGYAFPSYNPVVYETIAGFRKNGEFLLVSKKGHLVSYDPITKKAQDLGIPCSTDLYYKNLFIADSLTESVALVGITGDSCTENLALLGLKCSETVAPEQSEEKGSQCSEAATSEQSNREGSQCSEAVTSEQSYGEGSQCSEADISEQSIGDGSQGTEAKKRRKSRNTARKKKDKKDVDDGVVN